MNSKSLVSGSADSGAYTDLNRLSSLKHGDRDSDANVRKVAQEFESLFISEMLKASRKASDVLADDNPMNTETVKQYRDMYDQQLAVSMSREGGGIGLQDVLVRQLTKGRSAAANTSPFPRVDSGGPALWGNKVAEPAHAMASSATRNDVAALNARRLALAGAELIVVPTANMIPFDFVADVTVRARAFENQCYVAYANYCGHEGEIQYCGQSSIAAPDGSRIAQAGLDEALIVATLDRQAMRDAQAANHYLADRRPELYAALHKH